LEGLQANPDGVGQYVTKISGNMPPKMVKYWYEKFS
jgi:hypothetical protein